MAAIVAKPFFTSCGTGWMYDAGDHRVTLLADSSRTGGAFAMVETIVDPLGGPPPHVHTREEETLTILEGRFVFHIGEETYIAEAGDCVYMPRNVPHGWQNIGDTPGRMIVVITPGGFESFFTELAAKELSVSPETAAQIAPLLARYGVEMLAPPPSHATADAQG